MKRSAALSAATAIATLAAILLPAGAASADAPIVGIGVARTDAGNRGSFTVTAWTDADGATLTSVDATLRDGADSVDVPLAGVDGAPGEYAPAAPLELTADGGTVPYLGAWSIDITATDSATNTATRVGAGVLDFRLAPEFVTDGNGQAVHFTNSLSATQHATAATGQLVGVVPGTGATVPIAGAQVAVTATTPTASVSATTGPDGTFTSAPVTQSGWGSFAVSYTADDADTDGTAQAYGSTPDRPTPVWIDANAAGSSYEEGQPVAISGYVTNPGSTTPPGIPGVAVTVTLSADDRESESLTVTTSATGHFSASLPAITGYVVVWSAAADGFFYSDASDQAQGNITVSSPAQFTGTRIALSSAGRVTARGTLDLVYGGVAAYDSQTAELEYSKDGKTGWKVLARAYPSMDVAQSLSAWGYQNGYYRLYHPHSADVSHVASPLFHLSRIVTRIAGNEATPQTLHAGATVTVTGTLQEYRSGWRAMAHRPVSLYFLPSGKKTWLWMANGSTDTRGHATLHAKATKTGRWTLQYFGDSTHFDSDETSHTVTVR